jgi:hypothetical protein
MSEGLTPCRACARHIAARETACPFCGARRAQRGEGAEGPVARSLRVSRAALFAAGAGTLFANADCSQTKGPLDLDAEPLDAFAPDGPSNALDATADAVPEAGPVDATFDVPAVQPAYGGGVIFPGDGSTDGR